MDGKRNAGNEELIFGICFGHDIDSFVLDLATILLDYNLRLAFLLAFRIERIQTWHTIIK